MTEPIIGHEIARLISAFSKLPGLGPRSARRVVLALIKSKERLMQPLTTALTDALATVEICTSCGNLDTVNPCTVCKDLRRDHTRLCVVEDVSDLWALERSGAYTGYYHVLGGVLSAIDGVGPDDLHIARLQMRVKNDAFEEVILALSATVDGQVTANYIADELVTLGVTVTRLARGVPVGGELDYMDDGTLIAALKARQPV